MMDLRELFGDGIGLDSAGMGGGRAKRRGKKKGRGADLWRRVSEDMGVNVVFG
jgi:hypothetical protein